jgi:NAD(P)-dependent dehydrogenase (short-subunit alcohol dehydrogenase family)
VITGAGRGLGRAYALELARTGCAVVVNDIDSEGARATADQVRQLGGRAISRPGDVASAAFARDLVASCVAEFGALDILVNNAAMLGVGAPWAQDELEFRRIVDVNVLGTWFCGTEALRHMLAVRRGVVINTTSGALLGVAGLSAYGATKGAVASMTAAWAKDVADTDIRVSAIMPVARTEMLSMLDTRPQWSQTEQPPERIAPLIAYLASDAAVGLSGLIVRHDGNELSLVEPMSWRDEEAVAAPHGVKEVGAAVRRLVDKQTGSIAARPSAR